MLVSDAVYFLAIFKLRLTSTVFLLFNLTCYKYI